MVNLSHIFPRIPRRIWLIFPVAWMSMIFVLSSRESIKVSEEYFANFVFFKSLHIIEYAILMVCNVMALAKNVPHLSLRNTLGYSLLMTLLYAIVDEIHQTYVPTRTGKVQDVLIDSIGMISVYWLLSRYAYSQGDTP